MDQQKLASRAVPADRTVRQIMRLPVVLMVPMDLTDPTRTGLLVPQVPMEIQLLQQAPWVPRTIMVLKDPVVDHSDPHDVHSAKLDGLHGDLTHL